MRQVWLVAVILLVIGAFLFLISFDAQRRGADIFWAVIGYTGVGCLVVVATLVVVIPWSYEVGCRNTASNLALPYRWSVSAGCFYQLPDGHWWPSDNIRNVDGQLRVGGDVAP